MNCITAPNVYTPMHDEVATILEPAPASPRTIVEDTINSVVEDFWEGHYTNPVSVIRFNTIEGWWRDDSGDVARELRQRRANQKRELPDFVEQFVGRHESVKHA